MLNGKFNLTETDLPSKCIQEFIAGDIAAR